MKKPTIKNSFEVTTEGDYINTKYIRFDDIDNFDIRMSVDQYHQDMDSAETFMKYILDIEPLVKKILESKELEHDPTKIIAKYQKMLDAFLSGLDIRSDLGIEKHAEIIVKWFCNDYDKGKKFCDETLEFLKTFKGQYMQHWRKFDKYNELVRSFGYGYSKLDYKDLTMFEEDGLSSMLKSTKELLKKINESET